MNEFYRKDDPTKKSVRIVEDKDTFYQLSDGQMIKKDIFGKYYLPIISNQPKPPKASPDFVDPESFFSTTSVVATPDVVESIKKVDTSKITDDANRTRVITDTTDQTKTNRNQNINESVVRPAPQNQSIPNNTNTDVSQYKVYDNDDDAYNDLVSKSTHPSNPNQAKPQPQVPKMSEIDQLYEDELMVYGEDEANRRRNARIKKSATIDPSVSVQQPASPQPQFDPTDMMFRTFKRNHPISVTIKFEDKIGKPDFVKMMIENMDGDIVEFYKKLIMNNILKNIKHIEDEVEKCIRYEIFGDEVIDGLIPGEKTKTGKQLYKYLDEEGNVKELLPETAEKKGYKPVKPE